MLTKPWLRYELLLSLSRLSDANLVEHSLRCGYAAGDLRAFGALFLEALPPNLEGTVGQFLYDEVEVNAISYAAGRVEQFFDGGRWFGTPFPKHDDPLWTDMIKSCEQARETLISNGMPAWKPWGDD